MSWSERAIGTYAILATVVILFALFPPVNPFLEQSPDDGEPTDLVDPEEKNLSTPTPSPADRVEPLRVDDGVRIYHPGDPGPETATEVDRSRSHPEYEQRAFHDNGSVKNETVWRHGVVVERRTYDSTAIERGLVEEIDAVRRDHDREPWAWSPVIASAARKHSGDMATHEFVAHEGTDGSTPADRIDGAWSREDCTTVRENAAGTIAGFPFEDPTGTVHDESSPRYVDSNEDAAEEIVRQWLNSESHRDLLLDREAGVAGVGVSLAEGSGGELVRVYATLDVCFR